MTPETIETDSSTRSVPRRWGGATSEMYWRSLRLAFVLSKRAGGIPPHHRSSQSQRSSTNTANCPSRYKNSVTVRGSHHNTSNVEDDSTNQERLFSRPLICNVGVNEAAQESAEQKHTRHETLSKSRLYGGKDLDEDGHDVDDTDDSLVVSVSRVSA